MTRLYLCSVKNLPTLARAAVPFRLRHDTIVSLRFVSSKGPESKEDKRPESTEDIRQGDGFSKLLSHALVLSKKPAAPLEPRKIMGLKLAGNPKGFYHYERTEVALWDPVFGGDKFSRLFFREFTKHEVIWGLWTLAVIWAIGFAYIIYVSFDRIEIWVARLKGENGELIAPWEWEKVRNNYWKMSTVIWDTTGTTHNRLPIMEMIQDDMMEKVKCTVIPQDVKLLKISDRYLAKGYCIGMSPELGSVLITFENQLKNGHPYEAWVSTILDFDESLPEARIFKTVWKSNNAYWVMCPTGYEELPQSPISLPNGNARIDPNLADILSVNRPIGASPKASVSSIYTSGSSASLCSEFENLDPWEKPTKFLSTTSKSVVMKDHVNSSPTKPVNQKHQQQEDVYEEDVEDFVEFQEDDDEFYGDQDDDDEEWFEDDEENVIDCSKMDEFAEFFMEHKPETNKEREERVDLDHPEMKRIAGHATESIKNGQAERERLFETEGHIGIIASISQDRYFVYSPEFKVEPFMMNEDVYSHSLLELGDWIEFLVYSFPNGHQRVTDYRKIDQQIKTQAYLNTIRLTLPLVIPSDYDQDKYDNKVLGDGTWVKEVFDYRAFDLKNPNPVIDPKIHAGKKLNAVVQRGKKNDLTGVATSADAHLLLIRNFLKRIKRAANVADAKFSSANSRIRKCRGDGPQMYHPPMSGKWRYKVGEKYKIAETPWGLVHFFDRYNHIVKSGLNPSLSNQQRTGQLGRNASDKTMFSTYKEPTIW